MVGGSNPLVPTIFFIQRSHTVALILLTNDDGIDADGLRHLEQSVRGLADLVVVAPDRERSAVSHALTIHTQLESSRVAENRYALNGTPADCVIYALTQLLPAAPDLVISGINHGANLGHDINYSGTVAGAREAFRRGIPALAVSQAYSKKTPLTFEHGAAFSRTLVETLLQKEKGEGYCLNVNFPVGSIRGVRVTRQSCASHFPHFNSLDGAAFGPAGGGPREEDRYWEICPDYLAVAEQFVSITPLRRDLTDYQVADFLRRDGMRSLFGGEAPELG